jgi:hypothetical protein
MLPWYLIAAAAVIVLVLLPMRRRRRTLWQRDWVKGRLEFGAYNALLAELRKTDPTSAKNFLRMDDVAFQELLQLVRPLIEKQSTRMRRSIPAEERLALTLRFLASGEIIIVVTN